jgi:hypothetical protein
VVQAITADGPWCRDVEIRVGLAAGRTPQAVDVSAVFVALARDPDIRLPDAIFNKASVLDIHSSSPAWNVLIF